MTRCRLLETVFKYADKWGADDILWDGIETRHAIAELTMQVGTPALHLAARYDRAALITA